MLTHIHIRNLILIQELTLDLQKGLTIVTGETGAGKSIWVDAIQLALGSRAGGDLIRKGAERGEISLCFDYNKIPLVQSWLKEHALDNHQFECIIRRVIEPSKSRASINGIPVTLNLLQELAPLLLNIHGQHQHQTLLKEEGQQRQLDSFAEIDKELAATKQIYEEWHTLENEITSLRLKGKNRQTELDLLQFQFDELNQFTPEKNEWESLSAEHQQLAHSEQILETIETVLNVLSGDLEANILAKINKSHQQLFSLLKYLPQLQSSLDLLTQADIYLQETTNELLELQRTLEMNPERLNQVEQRLSQYHTLARKHQTEPDRLRYKLNELESKILALNNIDERIIAAEQKQQKIIQHYHLITEQISTRRKESAQIIEKDLTQFMQTLGMKEGQFKIKLQDRGSTIHPLGKEKISFLVNTNPGQELQLLQKIISGGELSRIHLALQVIIASKAEIPTLIFDEVDVGIGGQTAAIVGKLLQTLANSTQVICITHLPQVAAFGKAHFRASKEIEKQQTFSRIQELTEEERVEELARMLGGNQITSQTRAHAAELLKEST